MDMIFGIIMVVMIVIFFSFMVYQVERDARKAKRRDSLSTKDDILATLRAARELDDDQLDELASILTLPKSTPIIENHNLYKNQICTMYNCGGKATYRAIGYWTNHSSKRQEYGTQYICEFHFKDREKNKLIYSWECIDGRYWHKRG